MLSSRELEVVKSGRLLNLDELCWSHAENGVITSAPSYFVSSDNELILVISHGTSAFANTRTTSAMMIVSQGSWRQQNTFCAGKKQRCLIELDEIWGKTTFNYADECLEMREVIRVKSRNMDASQMVLAFNVVVMGVGGSEDKTVTFWKSTTVPDNIVVLALRDGELEWKNAELRFVEINRPAEVRSQMALVGTERFLDLCL